MSKRMTAIGAAALALALGCENEPGSNEEQTPPEQGGQVVGQNDDTMGPQHEQGAQAQKGEEQHRTFDQAPQQGSQAHGQQGQAGAAQAVQTPGQIVTMESKANFSQTISRLTREMRRNDLDVVSQVRYDRRTRERALRNLEQQQGAQGQGAQGQAARGQGGSGTGGSGTERPGRAAPEPAGSGRSAG